MSSFPWYRGSVTFISWINGYIWAYLKQQLT